MCVHWLPTMSDLQTSSSEDDVGRRQRQQHPIVLSDELVELDQRLRETTKLTMSLQDAIFNIVTSAAAEDSDDDGGDGGDDGDGAEADGAESRPPPASPPITGLNKMGGRGHAAEERES